MTYAHVTPWEDEPEDHHEGGCACDPLVDEASGTVFHRPLVPFDTWTPLDTEPAPEGV